MQMIYFLSVTQQGRIIHEAGEAEASGHGPQKGPEPSCSTKILHHFGPAKFLQRKIAVSVNKIAKKIG